MSTPTDLIDQYFRLAPSTDIDAYFAQFADNAVAEDEGHEYRGIAAIRAWRKTIPRVSYAVRDVHESAAEHVAHAEISGDFPGSPVTLAFHFAFTDDGQIQSLAIRT